MRRRGAVILAVAVLVAAGLAGGALMAPGGPEGTDTFTDREEVFHVTLADPSLYEDGVYEGVFEKPQSAAGMGDGKDSRYVLDFVLSGSSPETLSITMRGEGGSEYTGDFVLKGTRHEAGLGEFYTWEYVGFNTVLMPDGDTISITIDPNGDTQGSLSVYLYREE